MKVWKVILAALVIFSAGAVTGGLAVKLKQQSQPAAPTPTHRGPPRIWGPRQTADIIERMQKELDLTSDQRQKIEQILKSSHERSKQIWDSVAPKFQEEYRAMREAIRAQLTPEQQTKYEAVFKPHGKSGEGKNRENKNSGDGKGDKEPSLPKNSSTAPQ